MDKTALIYKIGNSLSKGNVMVCISGRSCSGKTTFANEIAAEFSDRYPLILCEDRWYKDLKDIKRDLEGYYDMESKEAFHYREFYNAVSMLINAKFAVIPNYNISENKRMERSTSVGFSPLIIIEGLHSLDIFKNMTEQCKMNKIKLYWIFVDTPIDVCVERRMMRDSQNFGIDPNFVRNHYLNVIERHYKNSYEKEKSLVKVIGGVVIE